MTDIEARALALINEVRRQYPNAPDYTTSHIAIYRAIERHEAFKQEVSDALVEYFGEHLVAEDAGDTLASFVIPKPKPDPLFDVMWDLGMADNRRGVEFMAARINEALEARGLEIREKEQ
jgi:hypothetical protein